MVDPRTAPTFVHRCWIVSFGVARERLLPCLARRSAGFPSVCWSLRPVAPCVRARTMNVVRHSPEGADSSAGRTPGPDRTSPEEIKPFPKSRPWRTSRSRPPILSRPHARSFRSPTGKWSNRLSRRGRRGMRPSQGRMGGRARGRPGRPPSQRLSSSSCPETGTGTLHLVRGGNRTHCIREPVPRF